MHARARLNSLAIIVHLLSPEPGRGLPTPGSHTSSGAPNVDAERSPLDGTPRGDAIRPRGRPQPGVIGSGVVVGNSASPGAGPSHQSHPYEWPPTANYNHRPSPPSAMSHLCSRASSPRRSAILSPKLHTNLSAAAVNHPVTSTVLTLRAIDLMDINFVMLTFQLHA